MNLPDISLFIIANIANVILAVMFLIRVKNLTQAEHYLGLAVISLAIPSSFIIIGNALSSREWWTIVLPSFFILYAVIELLFDYILKLEFRKTALLWPYLIIYFVALWGMIGYAFLTDRTLGYITLITYFINLAATTYSYMKVGH
jgi:hypothetical protein